MKSYQKMSHAEAVEAGTLILKNWCIANFRAPGHFSFRLKKIARTEVMRKLRTGEGFDRDLPGYVIASNMQEYMAESQDRYQAQIDTA